MTNLTFHADLGAESSGWRPSTRGSTSISRRVLAAITITSVPMRLYRSDSRTRTGGPDTGKIEDMLGRGVPIVVRAGEIEMKGSPLFDFIFDLAGENDIRLQVNKTVVGFANLLRMDESGTKVREDRRHPMHGRLRHMRGQDRGRIAARPAGPPDDHYIRIERTLDRCQCRSTYRLGGAAVSWTCPTSTSWQESSWDWSRGVVLDSIASLPDSGVLRRPRSISRRIARAEGLALDRNAGEGPCHRRLPIGQPTLPEDFESSRSLSEIQVLHEILLGEGQKKPTPSARVRVTVGRGDVRNFLANDEDLTSPGILTLQGDGSFPLLGDSIPSSHWRASSRPCG